MLTYIAIASITLCVGLSYFTKCKYESVMDEISIENVQLRENLVQIYENLKNEKQQTAASPLLEAPPHVERLPQENTVHKSEPHKMPYEDDGVGTLLTQSHGSIYTS